MIVLEERERKLWMILITGLTKNLLGNCSGRGGLKEGEDVVVEEWSPQEEIDTDIASTALGEKKKTLQAQPSEEKEG
jgi:hypothetical protein